MLRAEQQIARVVRFRPARKAFAKQHLSDQVADEFAAFIVPFEQGFSVYDRRKLEASEQGDSSWLELGDRAAYIASRLPAGRKLITDFTWEKWRRMLEAFNWACAYCASSFEIGQDHVISIPRGGTDRMSNIVPACLECNQSKGQLTLSVWLASRGASFARQAMDRYRKGKIEYERR